ncbi:TIGR01777 family oxidoreductase [Burkholderia gladioli]|uniref:TIGR01777 family oxidoreductase n=1 Tax=Burkholderia gladioli TaxID=28095 RepID=UPI0016419434|nr:TIGR01777 family oxidoreductase [Burkholderia gladioli]
MNTVPALDWAVALLIVQGLMGGFDTLYHHEFTEDLAHRPKARLELAIHAVRALLYGLAFASIAHLAFLGAWTLAIAALVLVEVLLTLWDFVVEDGSRKLPATERVLHTLLAINGGAVFGLYAMQLWHWAALPTALMRLELGWRGWLLSLFALGVAASGLRDGLAAWRMGRRAPPANPFAGQAHRSVLVTGGTGFIGEALVGQLLDAGHRVTLLTRSPLRAAYQFGGRVRCVTALDQLHAHEHFDVVINLAGAPVLGPRWSAKRQATLLASRVGVTEALLLWVEGAAHRPALWIQASAIGYYGVRAPEERLDETSRPGSGFMSELCRRWEAAAAPLDAWPIRKVVLRLGLVFGPGGALPPMLLPYRVGLGGRLGDGRQVMSWIHRDDVLRLIAEAMHRDTMRGVYNAVAPEAPSQAEFARTAGRVLRRPAWFRLPAAPLRRAAGEMAELLLDGQHVVPARLQREGFVFRFAGLEAALRDLVER